jgi:hypothetical protein
MNGFARLLILLLAVPLAQCSDDNPVDPGGGGGPPVSTSSALFQALGDTLDALGDKSSDEIRDVRFDDLRNGFSKILTSNPSEPIANLGLAILEILELNYNSDVWAIIDSVDSWDDGFRNDIALPGPIPNRHRTLIGRQFSLLVDVPMWMSVKRVADFPPNVTLDNIQNIVRDTVMPALGRSISHLAVTESNVTTSVRLEISDDGVVEYIVIDLGEIFLFDAAVHALSAAFGMMIAYDADLFGPDGTYDWIDDARRLDDLDSYCSEFSLVPNPPGPNDLYLLRLGGFVDAQMDSIFLRVLNHNFENRLDFLRLRSGGTPLRNAGIDLLMTLEKLAGSVDFIRNVRPSESEENVIKLGDLTDLDSDLMDPDAPNFAKDFQKIEDVLDFVETLLTGPVLFNEELGPSNTPFQWTLNLPAMFIPGVTDWKTLLPYHQWVLPVGNWINCAVNLDFQYDNGGFSWDGFVLQNGQCEYTSFGSVGIVRQFSYSCDVGVSLEFLDGPGGNVIDLGIERMPYLPDYTIAGLLPDMDTRQRWLDLINILD